MKGHHKITASEKKLFFVSAVAVALMFAFSAWRQWVDAVPAVTIPTPKLPSPNAYDFYVKAGAAIVPAKTAVDAVHDWKVVPKSLWETRYPTAKKEVWLQRNATALDLLRQGFKYRCRIPLQYSLAFKPTFGSSGKGREMGRMLRIESHVYQERGNWGKAADSALDLIRLGHDISQGGDGLNYFPGLALNSMARVELWTVLPHLDASESQAVRRRLQHIFQTRVTWADVLQEEKHLGQTVRLELMRLKEWSMVGSHKSTGLAGLAERWKMATTPKSVVFNNYTNYMDALIEIAQEPYLPRKANPDPPGDPFNHKFSTLSIKTINQARLHDARDETGNVLILVALALRTHQLEHNHYPKTLAELVPRYLKQVPADPFGGGEALRYKPAGATYSLYSIGPDGIDNRGRAIEDTKLPKDDSARFWIRDDSKGDVVAGINQ